jgi:hypothetical protein
VPPGEYRLRVEDRGLATQPVDVTIVADRETRLDAPLVLDQPVRLDVTVVPPTPPEGLAWSVALARAGGSPLRMLASETASSDGRVQLPLSAGDYYLTVGADGQQWFGANVRVDPDAGPLQIELPVVRVRGTIRLGNKPLAANVRLRHLKGAAEFLFASDDLGSFYGHLAGPGKWEAELEYGEPTVTRAIQALEVLPSPVTNEATLDIALPDTLLRGDVRTEDGTPLAGAVIRLEPLHNHAGEPVSDTTTDAEGDFEVRGLAAGPLLLSAEARQQRSDEVRVEVEEGDAGARDVHLITRATARLRGRVVGADGLPLPGAWVAASAMQQPLPIAGVGRRKADVEGAFEIDLAPGTRQASVFAGTPGYALRLFRADVPAVPGWVVGLSRVSGRLVLEFDEPWQPGEPHLLVDHNGARESLTFLVAFWSAPNGVEWDPRRVVLPVLEPGPYSVCRATLAEYRAGAPGGGCVGGVVPPGGELVLNVRLRRTEAGSATTPPAAEDPVEPLPSSTPMW